MKVVIAGVGIVGYQVARTLLLDGHDVVMMDSEPDVVRDIANRLDCMAVVGRSNNIADLLQANIGDADFFIALTGSDEINIISCALVSAEFKKARTIARVRSVEYGHGRLYQTLEAGIDHTINPETEAAVNILTSLRYGATSDVIAFDDLDIQIRNLSVPHGSKLIGQRLIEVNRSIELPFLCPLIARSDNFLIPSGDTVIQDGDKLWIAAAVQDFDFIFESLGKAQRELHSVLVLGEGRIAESVAAFLSGEQRLYGGADKRVPGLASLYGRHRVRLVTEDYERCKALSEKLPKVVVLQGDIADEGMFAEEQLQDCDVVLALGDSEERNIISGLYAKRRGIKRALGLVHSNNYLSIAQQLDLDVAISLHNAVATTILRIIREDTVENLQTLADGSLEIIEFMIDEHCPILRKPFMNLNFPPETLVLAIHRQGTSRIARGSSQLEVDDLVLVLCRKTQTKRVQDLFKAAES